MPQSTDYTREAQKIWKALQPMVEREVHRQTNSCVRAKKMMVVTPPDGKLVGVAEPYGQTVFVPYSSALTLVPGDAVWVYWYFGNASTMIVIAKGDGQPVASSIANSPFADELVSIVEDMVEPQSQMISAEYPSGAPYQYDDWAIYAGKLYRAIQDIPADEPFDSRKWRSVTLTGEVGSAVLYTPQALSSAQGLQAANNIGALTKGWGQTLTADQQQAVRDKIGLPFIDWDTAWTNVQKAQARKNLNAADIGNAKTPEMYGAVGDGATDDGDALLSAFSEASAAGVPLVLSYGKTYAIGRYVQMVGHRINVYGNGATIKVLSGTPTLNEALYISDADDGQFPDTNGKGLIENLTIDCNGAARCAIHIGIAKGYELQNLDICGFTERGLWISGGFEVFCENLRIAGDSSASTVGLYADVSDSRFVNIVTKNVGVGVSNRGSANFYTHVHAWNTSAQIIPTSVMFDNYANLNASDCYCDTCAICVRQNADAPVMASNLLVLRGENYMSSITPTVFSVSIAAYAARIKAFGMIYLNPSQPCNLFSEDVSQYAASFPWAEMNDSSVQQMGNFPTAAQPTAP